LFTNSSLLNEVDPGGQLLDESTDSQVVDPRGRALTFIRLGAAFGWITVQNHGDFISEASASVAGEVVVFSGTSGKRGTRATGTGFAKLTDGVLSTDDAATVRSDLGERVVELEDGATIDVDAALANSFRVTLGGNCTLADPTNLHDGQVLYLRIQQDGTGSRTLSFGGMYMFEGGVAPTLSTAAGAMDFMVCQYDAADDTLMCFLLAAMG
jgi:hypothetical protein